MNESTQPSAGLDPGLVTYTHIIYGLHALSVLIGVTGPATVIGSFVFGLPSIIAVIMNYVRRSEARGTWLESHFPGRSARSGSRSCGSSWQASCRHRWC